MKPEVTTDFQTGQAEIFKNPILERLTKTDPISNIIVYGLVIAFLVYLAIVVIDLSVLSFIGLFVFGLFFWTFAEYMLHRYVFHWVTEAKWSQRFHFIMHGAHHNFPTDKDRLLMPPVPGIILASFLFGIFYCVFWIIGYSSLVYGFFPGFFVGYLMYSFVHITIVCTIISIQIRLLVYLILSGIRCLVQCLQKRIREFLQNKLKLIFKSKKVLLVS